MHRVTIDKKRSEGLKRCNFLRRSKTPDEFLKTRAFVSESLEVCADQPVSFKVLPHCSVGRQDGGFIRTNNNSKHADC